MKKIVIKQAINGFAKRKGLSKNLLAEKLGVSTATLSILRMKNIGSVSVMKWF